MESWSLGVSIGGLVASVLGLVFAFLAHRSAALAKGAATSAEDAADKARAEAQSALSRSLSSVDIERAIALINRLKDLHMQGNWGSSLWLYQELRRTLGQIRRSMPSGFEASRDAVDDAIPQLTVMENLVAQSLHGGTEVQDAPRLNAILNAIQQELEILQSSMTYPDTQGDD